MEKVRNKERVGEERNGKDRVYKEINGKRKK